MYMWLTSFSEIMNQKRDLCAIRDAIYFELFVEIHPYLKIYSNQ